MTFKSSTMVLFKTTLSQTIGLHDRQLFLGSNHILSILKVRLTVEKNLTNCAPQKKLFENAYGTAFRDNETHMMPLPQNTVVAGLESRRRNSRTNCKLWQILVYLKDNLHLNQCISVIQQHRSQNEKF